MSDIYIGVYVHPNKMQKVLGRWPWRLNNDLSTRLRHIGYSQKIPKSRKRQLMKFYLVTKDEFEQFTNLSSRTFYKLKHDVDIDPKLAIEKQVMKKVLDDANKNYEKELDAELKKTVSFV
jgi:hypothetical protein